MNFRTKNRGMNKKEKIMKLRNIWLVAMSLLLISQVHAKQKEKIPDFSGNWESIADFCSFRVYHSYKLKQKKYTVAGYFSAGASKGQGGEWGRVKGEIRHGKLFIRECSMSGTNTPFACPKYSPAFYFLIKHRIFLLKYDNEKDLSKVKSYEAEPYILYKNKKNKKNFIPPVQKMHCDE